MGLRINSNINALIAIRNLGRAQNSQTKAIERLSSGFRINRASDDPSGLVMSNMLLGQLAGISQGIENSERALNMVQTADSALGEVVTLLNEIKSSALAAIGSTPDLISGEQSTVDAAISSIDRIASTTRFGDRSLLNGQASINVTSKSAAISDLRLNSVQFYGASQITFQVNVLTLAEQANTVVGAIGGVATDSATLEITGPLGTDIITVAGASVATSVADAVDSVRANTGVFASGSSLVTEAYGGNAEFRVRRIGGDVAASFTTVEDTGVDIKATVKSVNVTGVGNKLTVSTSALKATILIDPTAALGIYTFTAENSGMNFQLGGAVTGSDTYNVGFPNLRPQLLGTPEVDVGGKTIGGFLSDVQAGGISDLLSNPENAVAIVDAAIEEVIAYRAHLGGTAAFNIQPGINSLQTQFIEVTDAVSNIRDTDYAVETANLLRSQILLEAGIAVLGQATLVPTSVLDLLRL